MPLRLNRALSLTGRLLRRLRSSFSTVFFLQRFWNTHSGQCLFKIKSGGNEADNRATTWPMALLTARDIVLALTLKVAPLSPWMIFAITTFIPKAFERASASNPAINLSERASLFVG